MRIGYTVEDSTHRALLRGLSARWCPGAQMIEGSFRGSTGKSLRRELYKICEAFVFQAVDVVVVLTDCDTRGWHDVKTETQEKFPNDRLAIAIFGIAERNVECWICQDADYIAGRVGINADDLRVNDPKGRFESALGISRGNRKEDEIADLVRNAPLPRWLANPSFTDFYEQIRNMSLQRGCTIENLRDART